jgi:hypothetical protein
MNVDKELKPGPLRGWTEHKGWAFVHDAIAHPAMAFSGYASWAMRFHGWTGRRAWKPAHRHGPML